MVGRAADQTTKTLDAIVPLNGAALPIGAAVQGEVVTGVHTGLVGAARRGGVRRDRPARLRGRRAARRSGCSCSSASTTATTSRSRGKLAAGAQVARRRRL